VHTSGTLFKALSTLIGYALLRKIINEWPQPRRSMLLAATFFSSSSVSSTLISHSPLDSQKAIPNLMLSTEPKRWDTKRWIKSLMKYYKRVTSSLWQLSIVLYNHIMLQASCFYLDLSRLSLQNRFLLSQHQHHSVVEF